VNGWIYAGLAALGLTVGAISLVAVPVMAVWVGMGLYLGKAQEEKAAAGSEEVPAPPGSPVPGGAVGV